MSLQFAQGNLWDYYDNGYNIVIPTNLGWKNNGDNVMGAGLAKQAAERFPDLPSLYGGACRIKQGHWSIDFYEGRRLIMFPTKPCNDKYPHLSWQNTASLPLIKRIARQLRVIIERQPYGFQVAVPYVGCGNGGRTVEEVLPIIKDELGNLHEDYKIVVVGPINSTWFESCS